MPSSRDRCSGVRSFSFRVFSWALMASQFLMTSSGDEAVSRAEDVGMTANEFVADSVDHAVDVETAVLFAELRLEDDVKQQVSKFFGKALGVIVVDGLENLVGFLDQHGFQGVAILLPVPRDNRSDPAAWP